MIRRRIEQEGEERYGMANVTRSADMLDEVDGVLEMGKMLILL